MFATRRFRPFLFVASLLVTGLALCLAPSFATLAQCESPQKSSCFTCHEREAPVADNGEWHTIHAGKDLCLNCHGGNGTTDDQEAAHEGMTAQPLNDIYTDCHSCHPDYEARADRFAATIGVTPGSCATPTAVLAANIVTGPLPVKDVVPAGRDAGQPQRPTAFVAGILVSLVLFCAAACLLDRWRA